MSRYGTLLLGLGLLLSAVAGSRVWARVTVQDPVLGLQTRDVAGSALSPALSACALVALAATLVLVLTRGRARLSGLVVLVGSALWAAWLTVQALRDPVASARGVVTGPDLDGAAAEVLRGGATMWPWICLAGIVLVLAGTACLAWAWLATSRRPSASPSTGPLQRGGAATPPLSDAERARRANHDAWKDLSDGRDPTD
ncbi:MAG TPA: Trp biosynthesis-associated membrane protein [Ornithinimicrobium sp.]|uniref:Trp biosynthesis-associated membrane protein n=1 Tax=Ornithinimicrobium sp. TaxID=1977084 RepID=UPI002B46A0F7|nr:Trp biosynthesis-associated membrane protein [Ornithinimicrobium sp.]HKJ11860.1 Trp biosynthesis-associated membrane protein [Ornithinimicrobium sp.]